MSKSTIYILLGLGAIMLYTGYKKVYEPRGLRNNNAGNLRLSSDSWQGLADEQTDGAFFQFVSPEYGIRALSKVLLNYESVYGLNTVAGIISRYAPSSENDTNSYISSVVSKLSTVTSANQVFSVRDNLSELVNAIIIHENGYNPYSQSVLNDGISMAFA